MGFSSINSATIKTSPMSAHSHLTVSELITQLDSGRSLEFLYFWKDTPKIAGTIDSSCLSNWYPAVFTIDDIEYPTVEHYMMAEKARLFKDDNIHAQILKSNTPREAKNLGRTISGFNSRLWNKHRMTIVIAGNFAKFSQHQELKGFLIHTHPAVLVEASPYDRIWGIGLKADDPSAKDPFSWQGENLLGFALMEVRDLLMATEAQD